jgi:hypothetical protein
MVQGRSPIEMLAISSDEIYGVVRGRSDAGCEE